MGHTEPKKRKVLRKAVGGVLFIDDTEYYFLILSKERYAGLTTYTYIWS